MKSAYPLTCAALLLPQISVIANIQLPAVISDHMVLQQGVSAPIWGWADAGEEVRISVRTESGNGANAPEQIHNAKADSEGNGKLALENFRSVSRLKSKFRATIRSRSKIFS